MTNRLRKLAGLISPRLAGTSVCESCGSEFTCGASLRGCWCAEIKLTDEARAQLNSNYRGCLCRACLEVAAATPNDPEQPRAARG